MRLRQLALALGAVVLLGGGVLAQGRFRGNVTPVDDESLVHNVEYDGRFTFARARFNGGPGSYYYGGMPAWSHGYPRAERDLMQILNEVSDAQPRLDASNVLKLDDPELFKYPVLYMAEGTFWTLSDTEAASFRAYLLKGGFVMFDDFRDDFNRGSGGWQHFATNMQRVLPEARWIDLDPSMPVYHTFFEIPSFDVVRQFYDGGRPAFRGIFEGNDPTKRLMVVANFNTDVANFWEFSATGSVPVSESNEAYKLGVNYVIYGMTH